MADTVYEENGITFTRYWAHGDWVQITFVWRGDKDFPHEPIHVYCVMPIEEFRKAYRAVEASVKQTSEAWWHKIKEIEIEKHVSPV